MFEPALGCRALAAATAIFIASVGPAAAGSRLFEALATPDPDRETAAPADSRLTAACQTAARERLGRDRLSFSRSSHTSRDGVPVVRIDLTAGGEAFRAVCTRDAAGSVAAVVFAGPVNEIGPRVIVLGGPTPEMRPRSSDPGYRIVARDPAQPDGYNPYYPGYYGADLPGLWFDGDRFPRHADRGRDAVTGGPATRFGEARRGSSAPFADGGIASPGISNFPSRPPNPGIASPAISNFRSTAPRGGFGGRSSGGRSGGGSIGR
jgi:hypothetical protein